MNFFSFNKRSSSSAKAPKARPQNPQPLMSPLESRQLMSVAAPEFPAFYHDAGLHAQAISYDSAAVAHVSPAFGQASFQDIPAFDENMNYASMPAGLIGGNVMGPHGGPGFDQMANFAFTSVSDFHTDSVTPAIVGSVTNTPDSAAVDTTAATPGTGLTSLVQQIASADTSASTTAAAASASVALSNALTGLNDASTSAAIAASTTFHTQTAAIAAKLENLLAILATTPGGTFQPVTASLPQIGQAPTITADVPAAPMPTHVFSGTAVSVASFAKSVGEAFLDNVVSDLAQFESGLDSAVTQLGHSVNMKEAAVAGAVVALAAYLQRNNNKEEKKIDDTWLLGQLVGEPYRQARV